jgi:hypothetical protein
MRTRSVSLALLWWSLLGASCPAAAQTADIYFVDVGLGNATFVVSPAGQTMLLDTGPSRAANRILAFMKQAGLRQVDYLVVSHFEEDHMGAAPRLAEQVPILNWVDHGESVVFGKDDEWWRQRRGPWARPGMGKQYDESFESYRKARATGSHIIVRPGDKIPVGGLDVVALSAAGKTISAPLKGAGIPNPVCASIDRRAEDDAEDGQSIGILISFGAFRFIYLGDLTWNTANSLFCPKNLVGVVDAYLVTHHAQSMTRELGDYYYGLSCCSQAELHGLRPRAAFLSLGALGHKFGADAAMKVIRNSPGLEDLWQTEKIVEGGEKGHNPPDQFIANIGEKSEQVPFLKLSASSDGSFAVTNSRNQYTKTYPRRK